MGIYAATSSWPEKTLWSWDVGGRGWTTDGLTLPPAFQPDDDYALAGIDGGLLFLFTGSGGGSAEDDFLWSTWRASPAR